MFTRPAIAIGAAIVAVASCGGSPYYDTCNAYDYYSACYDPLGYCDPYGCVGLTARAVPTQAFATAGPSGAGTAIARDLGAAVSAAEAVRRSAPAASGPASVRGPVDLGAGVVSGLPAATYRLTLDRTAGEASWRLEVKPTGAPDERFRAAFTGRILPAADSRDIQGVFGLDLDAFAVISPDSPGGGQVLGSFTDRGGAQATAYRLRRFRMNPGAAPLPDVVLTDTKAVPPEGAAPTSSTNPRLSAAGEAPGRTLAAAAPPSSMPGS